MIRKTWCKTFSYRTKLLVFLLGIQPPPLAITGLNHPYTGRTRPVRLTDRHLDYNCTKTLVTQWRPVPLLRRVRHCFMGVVYMLCDVCYVWASGQQHFMRTVQQMAQLCELASIFLIAVHNSMNNCSKSTADSVLRFCEYFQQRREENRTFRTSIDSHFSFFVILCFMLHCLVCSYTMDNPGYTQVVLISHKGFLKYFWKWFLNDVG